MRSKTSFCNRQILRSDITRFSPLWILYTILLLLICVGDDYAGTAYHRAVYIGDLCQVFVAVNGIYAFAIAQCIYGDLMNSRLCNAIHALPVSRSILFCTHTVAGLLMCLVPNTLVCLAALPMAGQAAPAVLWLWLSAALQFLFFFGTAELAVMLAGNRIGMTLVYGCIHFIMLLVLWFAKMILEPLMYGVTVSENFFLRLCPTYCIGVLDAVTVTGYGNGWINYELTGIYPVPKAWAHLAAYAAVGILSGAAALFTYRKRRLETAGDLLAVRWLKPVYLVLFTLAAGAFFQLVGTLFIGNMSILVFLPVGILVGWFAGLMLLERQTQVFRKDTLIPLGGLLVLVALLLGAVILDAFGLVTRVPDISKVEKVYIFPGYEPENSAILTSPQEIEAAEAFHRDLLSEYRANRIGSLRNKIYSDADVNISIEYRLKDGTRFYRAYSVAVQGERADQLNGLFNRPESVFGFEGATREKVIRRLETSAIATMYDNRSWEQPITDCEELVDAILADMAEGNIAQLWALHRNEDIVGTIQLYPVDHPRLGEAYEYSGYGSIYYQLPIFTNAKHTTAYLLAHGLTLEEGEYAGSEKAYIPMDTKVG